MSESSPAVGPQHYRLPVAQLDSLASGTFEPEAITTLLSGERSRRLLLLRAVRDYARARDDSTGPLAAVDTAWNLLLRAEAADRETVEEMLANPQTGTWVAHTLRRLRDVGADPAPLWFHVGQLHTFALAAAIRAGLSGNMTVPVWDGVVHFPSLGCLRLSTGTGWHHAEAAVSDGVVSIRCAGTTTVWDPRSGRAPGWLALRWLRAEGASLDLRVRLEDLGAYRGLDNPVRPAPLPAADVERWQALLDDAWQLLTRDHPRKARALATALSAVVPEPAAFRFRPRSTSVEDGFGAAILSEPYDAAQLAVTLVHEAQHSLLNGVRHLVELVSGDDPATGYAPWRDDPRPVGGLMHGVFAFTAVAEFWGIHRSRLSGPEADLAHFEFALWRHQTLAVLRAMHSHPALTPHGTRFLTGISTRLDRLATEPVPAWIDAAARAAAADHAAGWRACHLRPAQDHVRAVAAAWTAGQAPPHSGDPASTVEPGRLAQRLDVKAVLMRARIADPAFFDRVRADPNLVPGASKADVAYVDDDLAGAHRGYLAELSRTPNRAAAWSGLGLTLQANGAGEAATIVLRQPELLRAVVALIPQPERPAPDRLATWLAQDR